MPLVVFIDVPFTVGTECDQSDFYTGDGVTEDFVLVNKAPARLGAGVQFDTIQYYGYNGGFTTTSNGFDIVSAPPANSQGVAPGITTILFDQIFDQNDIPGVPNANIQQIPFYVADPFTIPLYEYTQLPGSNGISLSIVDMISAAGAQTSWCQLACATNDLTGSALTYQATGTTLYTGVMTAFGTILASTVSGASSMSVSNANTFGLGDYVLINGGQATQEVVKVLQYTPPNTIGTSGFNFNHYAGETVYTCGRKFWMRCTVPIGVTGGQPVSFFDLALNLQFLSLSRL